MGKRISWVHDRDTQTFSAFNKEEEMLGVLNLEKVGRYKHWVWYQKGLVGMSPGCLQEVREKQKELFKQRS